MAEEKRHKKPREEPIPATYTKEDIEKLQDPDEDWHTAYDLIRKHKIRKPKTMTTLQDFKQLLLNHLLQGQDEVPVPDDFSGKAEIFKQKREHVEKIYNHLKEFTQMSDCTDSVKSTIQGRVRGWEEMLGSHSSALRSEKLPILVAGETGAGKSSFINLLIGADILPVDDALSTTSCICEIHHNEKKRVLAYPTEKGKKVEDKSLEGKNAIEVQQILNAFAHEAPDKTDDTLQYERVEIHWPVPFLRAGLFLVDSPGVGDRAVMTKRTKAYVESAIAFIYILNSEAAGGFTEGRLDELLSINTEQKDESKLRTFTPESALFVFNKWEKIKEDIRAKIKERVLERLKEKWPGLNLETQVHYLSVKVANTCRSRRIRLPDEYVQFLDKFHAFLESGLENDITSHVRWLDYLMNHVETCIKTPLVQAKQVRKNNHENIARISECLRKLKDETDAIVQRLYNKLKVRTEEIAKELHVYLKRPETFQKLKEGALKADLPTDEDMKINRALVKEVIKRLLMAETSNWEDETHRLKAAKEEIRGELVAEFKIISDELAKIEQDMKGTTNYAPTIGASIGPGRSQSARVEHVFSPTEKMVIGITSPLWMPLAGVAGVLMAPIVGSYSLISQLTARFRLAKYQKDRQEAMEKWLSKIIKNLTESGVKRDIVAEHMKEVYTFIMRFQLDLPEIIESSKKLINDIMASGKPMSEILEHYEPLWQKLNLAFGLRNMYYFNYRLPNEPNVYSDISIIKDMSKVARGTFADISNGWIDEEHVIQGSFYCMKLPTHEVTVKKFLACIDETNVTDIILERDLLCQINKHSNIIDLIGTIYSNDINGRRMMLIFERCEGTLRQAIFENTERIPANNNNRADRKKAMEYILDKLVQICCGLNYLHGVRCVHRDLKLGNILLKHGCVKLADLGRNKANKVPDDENSLSAFAGYAGTPQYTDPNILKERYVQTEADVYSLALVMWESWYGQDVYNGQWDEQLAEEVKNGHRPGFNQHGIQPFEDYRNLIEICWCGDAYDRPEMLEVEDVLKQIKAGIEINCNWDDFSFTRSLLVNTDRGLLLESIPIVGQHSPHNAVFDSIDSTTSLESYRGSPSGPIFPSHHEERKPKRTDSTTSLKLGTSGSPNHFDLNKQFDSLTKSLSGIPAEIGEDAVDNREELRETVSDSEDSLTPQTTVNSQSRSLTPPPNSSFGSNGQTPNASTSLSTSSNKAPGSNSIFYVRL